MGTAAPEEVKQAVAAEKAVAPEEVEQETWVAQEWPEVPQKRGLIITSLMTIINMFGKTAAPEEGNQAVVAEKAAAPEEDKRSEQVPPEENIASPRDFAGGQGRKK